MFPRDRRSDDGRYVYCLACCRRRTSEYRSTRQKMPYVPRSKKYPARKPMIKAASCVATPKAIDLVHIAITNGKCRREEIREATRLRMDDVCEALAVLAFDSKVVEIKKVAGDRIFVLRAA